MIIATEADVQRKGLEPDERVTLYEHLEELVDDLGERPATSSNLEADKAVAEATPPPLLAPTCRVLSMPARAQRDELAAGMLTQILRQQGFEAESVSAALAHGEMVEHAAAGEFEVLCISVVPPSTLVHARYLANKLRVRLPDAKIVVGLWGATENLGDASLRLRSVGVDEVVVTFAGAAVQLLKYSSFIADEMMIAPRPENEAERQAALDSLGMIDTPSERSFDRITARVARVFQVPIALINFIDRDQQWVKSQTGLPDHLAAIRSSPRDLSICGHMVADNAMLVVEDIQRDRRFANNPLLKENGIRFYAGVPLRVGEHAVGSICLLGLRPRKFSQDDRRLLQLMADEVMEELVAAS